MSDTLDLAAIKTRAEAATEQRWSVFFSVHGDPSIVTDLRRPMFTTVATVSTASNDYGRATARHIGNMDPATTLALVAEVERLTDENATLLAAIEHTLPLSIAVPFIESRVRRESAAEATRLRAAVERVAGKAERTAYAATEDEGHVEPEAWRAMAADLAAALSDAES